MKTPSAREVMGLMRLEEFAKVGGPKLARPPETYRAARRALAKAIYRQSKKAQTNGA